PPLRHEPPTGGAGPDRNARGSGRSLAKQRRCPAEGCAMTEAKRYLLVSWDGGGNVPPELAIARRLVARGHSVRVLADPTIEAEARAHGCEFSAWTHAPHRRSRDRSHDIFKDYEIQNPLRMMDTYLREFLAGPAPRWAEDTRAELAAR